MPVPYKLFLGFKVSPFSAFSFVRDVTLFFILLVPFPAFCTRQCSGDGNVSGTTSGGGAGSKGNGGGGNDGGNVRLRLEVEEAKPGACGSRDKCGVEETVRSSRRRGRRCHVSELLFWFYTTKNKVKHQVEIEIC